MASTILGILDQKAYKFEPDIVSVTGKDGITAFSFSIIGNYIGVKDVFDIGQNVDSVPNQPVGSFAVVNRNLEHVAGGISGIYRLSVSAEGGQESEAQISETSMSYQTSDESGITAAGALPQVQVIYRLEWLYPSATITTNSATNNSSKAESLATSLVSSLVGSIIQDRPTGVFNGRKINLNKIILTGTSVERAGGLYRIRATASKGSTPSY